MNAEESEKDKKPISLFLSIAPIIITLALLIIQLFIFNGDAHIPLIIGVAIVASIGWYLGFRWQDIEDGMTEALKPAITVIGGTDDDRHAN